MQVQWVFTEFTTGDSVSLTVLGGGVTEINFFLMKISYRMISIKSL